MSSTVESAADMGTFNFGFCNQRNIECLFHNKSACKFGVIDVMRMRKANEHIFDWGNIPTKIPPNFPIHYQPNQHVPQLLPTRPELARKMLGIPGIFAAVSLFAAYVFDLNEQMLSSALNRARAMGLEIDKPYIGVHIRRAGGCSFAPLESCLKRDKHCWTGRKCTETSDYANYVRYLAERYHPRGDRYVVFAASDDDTAVTELSRRLGSEYSVISQRNVVSRDKKYAGLRNDIETHLATGGKKAVQSLAEEATTDVLLLAHASQLVLTLSSQMSRLILELSFAVHGYVVPFLAADWAWCWAAWGKVQPTTRYGIPYGIRKLPPC
jgi:hypothetical protein